MASRIIIAILSTLLSLFVVGYISKDAAANKADPKGHVDLGGEVSFNVYVATVKLFLNLRDADSLVIKAIDWASRQIRYFLNGREQLVTLKPDEIRILQQKGQPPAAAKPPPAPAWVPGKLHPSIPNVVAAVPVNEWRPGPGYDWLNCEANDLRVRWKPGVVHPQYPNVVAQNKEREWRAAPGYRWLNDDPKDLRVAVEIQKQQRPTRCR